MGIDIFLPPEVAAARLLCLRVAVVATVVLQTLVLIRMPVPSPVSIHRARGGGARIMAHGLFWTAFLGGAVPVAASVSPSLYHHLLPIDLLPEGLSLWLGGMLLAGGNAILLLAVVALRRHTDFEGNGESMRLLTRGVFGLLRHPIVAGMGAIYAGCLLIWPTLLGTGGMLAFCVHQHRCLNAEEALLEIRFGMAYRRYRDRVGRFWPRLRLVPVRGKHHPD